MTKSEKVSAKIHSLQSLEKLLNHWRKAGKTIVFTNGCFDLLHLGHADYLSKAASLGDVMVVGVNTDASVSRIKGPDRPITDEKSRSFLMASFEFVDAVVLFDEPTPYSLIRAVQPNILVKGKDYKAEEVVGYDIVTANGGRVETIDLMEGYSSSAIIQKIIRTEK